MATERPEDRRRRRLRSPFGRGRRRTAVLCSSAAAALVLAASAAADWNQYRGDAARTGSVLWDGASAPRGVVDWRKELGSGTMVDASPVVNPNTGVIYLGTTGESPLKRGARLFAFYPNGNLRWAVPLNGYDVRAAPAVRRDGFPVVIGDKATADHRNGWDRWQLSERAFLINPFTGAVRAVRSEPAGWFGMSPVVDESRNEVYVRTATGLWLLDWSFALLDDLKAWAGVEQDTGASWDAFLHVLCLEVFCPIGFNPSGLVGRSPDRPQPPRLPSPAYSPTCDDVVWSLPQSVRAPRQTRRGRFLPPIPVATPALGKAGRMYAPVLDKGGKVFLEAYDQTGERAWRTGPLGDGPVSPPALGRAPTGQASTTATCTRVRDGKTTVVRDQRADSVYLAVGATLYAFDGRGRLRWKNNPGGLELGEPNVQLGEPIVARLKTGDELILVTWTDPDSKANSIVAYRSDGRVVWRVALDAPALGSPAIANGRIYLATTRSLYAIH